MTELRRAVISPRDDRGSALLALLGLAIFLGVGLGVVHVVRGLAIAEADRVLDLAACTTARAAEPIVIDDRSVPSLLASTVVSITSGSATAISIGDAGPCVVGSIYVASDAQYLCTAPEDMWREDVWRVDEATAP